MPALFAGGVCCAVLAFVDGAGLLAGAGVAAGLLAGSRYSLVAAGAEVDLLAGAELAAGATAGVAAAESAAVAFWTCSSWSWWCRRWLELRHQQAYQQQNCPRRRR